jgi:hypothetical protein
MIGQVVPALWFLVFVVGHQILLLRSSIRTPGRRPGRRWSGHARTGGS